MKKMVRHGLWAPLLGAILLSAGCVTDWDPETDGEFADGSGTETSSRELEGEEMASESRDTTLSNAATFVSQSVPATMVGGQKYTVSITMRNDGTATWNRDGANPYRLGSQPQDTQLWVTTRAILPSASVTPGGLATFSFQVTAPSTPGTYDFQWRMVQELVQWFGPVTPKVTVAVTAGVPPLYSGFYLRNWPTGDGLHTQWSDLSVSNPNDVPALVTIRIHKRTGGVHAVVQQTIAARGSWNSYGQSAWNNIPSTDPNADPAKNASLGWIEVGSDRRVIATQRLTFRTGSTYNSPPTLFDDDVLSPEASTKLYAAFYLKNWHTGNLDKTQWSDLVLVNPSCCSAANVTITVHKVDEQGLHGSFTQSIAPGAAFNTYGLPAWLNMPDANPRQGWVEVTSDRPLVGLNRVTVRNGSTFNAPTVLLQDEAMSGKRETYLGSAQFVKDWDVAGMGRESSYPILVNPGPSSAEVEIRVYRTDGSFLTFNRTIPGQGSWNSATDTPWKAMAAARGWVSVYSPSAQVFGTNRTIVLDGSTLVGLDDALLTTPFMSAGYATSYLKNWPSGDGSSTQWANIMVSNLQRSSAMFTLNVFGGDGALLNTFQKSIPAFGRWDSYGDPEWLAVPPTSTFPTGPASSGWIELIPTGLVQVTNRVTLRSGTTYDALIDSFQDVELVPAQP